MWWLHLAKADDLKVVVGCADIAERDERDRIGSSARVTVHSPLRELRRRKKERKQTTQGRHYLLRLEDRFFFPRAQRDGGKASYAPALATPNTNRHLTAVRPRRPPRPPAQV